MKYLISLVLITLLIACNPSGSKKPSSIVVTAENYCSSLQEALTGSFKAKYMEGTMTWSGGLVGSVEIAGLDFNDMTCTYNVTNCNDGAIEMTCNGGYLIPK